MITLDKTDNSFNVTSLSTPGKKYNVSFEKHRQEFTCECMHWSLYQTPCNHIKRVTSYCKRKYHEKEKS
jgi:hypothetical protein